MIESFVSREDYDRLLDYSTLLLKWNKTINLIAPGDVDNILQRHVLDSLQLLKFIDNKDISIIDLGSGAGLPGIILSIAGIKKVTLIESDSRKAAFLFQASKLSNGNIEIINDRLENISDLECDIVTTRAFANLNKIFCLSENIKVQDKYLLHKGEKHQEEIDEARKHWLFNSKVHDSISSNRGQILEITDLRHK